MNLKRGTPIANKGSLPVLAGREMVYSCNFCTLLCLFPTPPETKAFMDALSPEMRLSFYAISFFFF